MSFIHSSIPCFLSVPVVRCGEGRHDDVPPIDVNDVRHSLQDVEVEVGVAGDGAVQARLEEGRPLFLQDAWRATAVILTDPGHPWKHHLIDTRRGERSQFSSSEFHLILHLQSALTV